MDQSIEKRLGQIEKRLQRIEARLDLQPLVKEVVGPELEEVVAQTNEIRAQPAPVAQWPSDVTSQISSPPVIPVAPIAIPIAKRVGPPPLPQRAPQPQATVNPEAYWTAEPASEIQNPQSKIQNDTGVLPSVSPAPKPPQNQSSLEQAIGLKWAGWVGAVILLIGAALGVKYAYDQHWFGQLPVWIWPSILAACGFALIGAGEWVYRKVNVIPAASFFGAGVATLFLVSYIGHSYYQLYSPTTAFILMGLTTLIGSAVAMRGKMVSIAVLSIIGGNVAPLVMGDSGAPHFTFMVYLLALQVVALTLAWWGQSRRWWTLRGLSLATTALSTSAMIAAHHDGMMPLGFAILYAVLYHVEVIASALRADRDPEKTRSLQHGGALFITLVIAGLAAAILSTLSNSAPMTRATWLVAEALACAIAGFALRDPVRRLTRSLAPAYTACAAGLLTVSVPVAFDGMSVEIGWAILAIAMAIIGRTLKSTMAKTGAVVAWGLALAHLIFTSPGMDVFREHPALQVWLTIDGVGIASTTIIAWGLALVGHVIAGLMQSESALPSTPIESPQTLADSQSQEQSNNANIPFAAAIPRPTDSDGTAHAGLMLGFAATIVFIATSILALPPLGATLSLIAFAWLALFIDIPLPRLRLAMHSIGVLLIATIKWVAIDTLGQRLSPDWSATQYAPIVNPMMGIGLLLAGSLVGAYWLRRESIYRAMPERRHAPLAAGLALAVVALLAIAFSFEIDRVIERAVFMQHTLSWPAWQLKQMAWTMLWSLCSLTLAFVISRITALGERRTDWVKSIAVFSVLMVVKFILLDTLIYRLMDGSATAQVVFNLQTLTAMIVVGALVLVRKILQGAQPQATDGSTSGAKLHLLALFVVAWTGTFEIERFVILHPAIVSPWPIYQFKQMAWTTWWTLCAVGGFAIGRRVDRGAHAGTRWARILPGAIMMLAVKFALADALFWRITDRVTLAPVIANMQALTAAVSIGAMITLIAMGLPGEGEFSRPMRIKAGFLAWILALLAMSLEIDRYFESASASALLADPRLAKQVAFSITWSIFAVMSVAAGFKIRLASLRYFGLALLAFTLLKVVTIDLGQVSTGYRILSFLGLGLLMLGTSVLYGKLSPRLLRAVETPEAG